MQNMSQPKSAASSDLSSDIDPRVYREMGVLDSEYALIMQTLGRTPTYTEIGMYSVMWSEHCGYKYSRPILKAFGEYKKAQETGALENAGVVPLGNTGWGVAFKMESHNHPSAVEPYQGAATGVGGILRDIFTMGARPIASLNSLRFGPIEGDDPHVTRNKYLFEHVVKGVGDYGNCVGVPTVGGEITFHPCYNNNPLVNAMSVGIVELSGVASAKASGVGNPVLYAGSATGRDGIHGATFASVELTEESEAKRPNVQVGDPFTEKLLIEATLEALATGFIVGIQDMGAAGLTCGTCEMAAKGSMGMDVDVRFVPRREEGMTPYEIMLSESQERMLAVVEKGHEDDVARVFQKWGLQAAYIGHVTDTGRVVIREGGQIYADVPAKSLADDCPTYQLDAAEPDYIVRVQSADMDDLSEPSDYADVLLKLLGSPTIASKRWVWEQYDTQVQTQTEVLPGRGDAAVLWVREAARRIALTTDCNARFCYLDPFGGAQLAVAEAARNISCVGATPRAVTDCLNFPSPEKPEGFWQFTQAVHGMAQACDVMQTPVVSGNVSFYNETPDGAIFPTPTVGMVGVFDENITPCQIGFQNDNDLIYLLRPHDWENEAGIGGSEYLSLIHRRDEGKPPHLDLEAEMRVQTVVRQAIAQNLLNSAHDCSEGGAIIAIAESCLAGGTGAEVRFSVTDFGNQNWAAILFGEAASRIIVSVPVGAQQDALLDLSEANHIEAVFIGQVKTNDRLDVAGVLDVPVSALRDAYENAIPRAMGEVE